jgi:predicted anti-sigma-YlaC factor YlaD
MMRKCKQIIELTSQQLQESLPWLTRLEVQMHLLMCKTCQRYKQQLSFIDKALAVMEQRVLSQKLSESAKQKMAKKLQQVKAELEQ